MRSLEWGLKKSASLGRTLLNFWIETSCRSKVLHFLSIKLIFAENWALIDIFAGVLLLSLNKGAEIRSMRRHLIYLIWWLLARDMTGSKWLLCRRVIFSLELSLPEGPILCFHINISMVFGRGRLGRNLFEIFWFRSFRDFN